MTAFLPKVGEAMVENTGQPRPSYRRWMQQVTEAVNTPATPPGPDPEPPTSPISFVINGSGSVTADGSVAGGEFVIGLDNDKDEPGNTKYYGTDSAGNRGFVALSEGLEAGTGIALTDSGYTMLPSVATPADLPLTGNAGEAVRVTDEAPGVYAWDGAAFTLDAAADGKAGIVLDASLDELNDVAAPSPTDGQALVWSASGSQWQPGTVSGYSEGTANPGSPVLNQKFYRTDLNLLIYYDGTRWLTANEYAVALTTLASAPFQTAGGASMGRSSPRLDHGTYMTRYQCITRVDTTNNGSNYWAVTLSWDDATVSAGTTIATNDTSADTAGMYTNHSSNINAVLDATAMAFYLSVAKTGSPGQFTCNAQLFYRLIVT